MQKKTRTALRDINECEQKPVTRPKQKNMHLCEHVLCVMEFKQG